MVNSLNCLWHNTIISGNYKNSDICRLCTSHTHSSKCLMSRRIKECNLLTINFYYRCTDVLCNTTSFSCCYI